MLDNISEIKKELKQNEIHVDTFESADRLLYFCVTDKYVVFDKIQIKNYFINNTNRIIINCNSSYEKFVNEIDTYYDLSTIFNNINACNDEKILSIISKTNNLKIE